jgi:hypothetical protein
VSAAVVQPGEAKADFLLGRLRDGADRSFSGYDVNAHGCGVAELLAG